MTRNDDIEAALRTLDPADHVDPTSARALADFRAIVATDPAAGSQQPPASRGVTEGRQQTGRRVALAGLMVAAIAAGIVATPSLFGGDRAFATWTPVPASISAERLPEAAAACRKSLEDGAGADYAEALAVAETVIAERRGVWTTVVLAGSGVFSATCIADDSTRLFAGGMIGSIGVPPDFSPPGPRELFVTDLGVGSMTVVTSPSPPITPARTSWASRTPVALRGTWSRPCPTGISRSGCPATNSKMRRATGSR